jgi:hypothetical protein
MWVQEEISFWSSVVTDLAFKALSCPQTDLSGLKKLLQHE